MPSRFTRAFVMVPLAAIMLGTGFAAALAQDRSPLRPPARINVAGEGEVRLASDMAIVNLSVMREAETPREALTATNEAMGQLHAALKEAGISERDMQTTGLNIHPRYQRPTRYNELKESKIIGYTVTNALTVQTRDLSIVGKVLDTAVTLGVNRSTGLRFVNDNTKEGLAEARKLAMADALERAKTLTDAAGVRLGRIMSINERTIQPRPVSAPRQATMREDAAPASVPVATGENVYRVTVNVSFEIEQ